MRKEIERLFQVSLPGVQLTDGMWDRLLPLCHMRRLARHSVLFSQGQRTPALFGVFAGEVEIRFLTIDGAVSVIEHVGADRLFGLAAFVTGQLSSYEAIASRPTRVVALGPAAYDYLMDQVPSFARILLREFALRHQATLRLLESSRHHTAIERLSLALIQLVHEGRVSEVDDRGWYFVRVTQNELAALANVSRQTSNETIREMVRQKRLRTAYGGLWVSSI